MTFTTPSSLRRLAQRLLSLESTGSSAADPSGIEAGRVFQKLQVSLTRLAGAEGFTSLLRRALGLARKECPALHRVTLKPDGSLEGLESLAEGGTDDRDGAVAITAHLIGLLNTFIGQSLTVQLLRDVWPDASLDE